MNHYPAYSEPLSAEDEAFDRAFHEAAWRELTVAESLIPTRRSVAPVPPVVAERRARNQRLVLWIVGAAGLLMVVALVVGGMT